MSRQSSSSSSCSTKSSKWEGYICCRKAYSGNEKSLYLEHLESRHLKDSNFTRCSLCKIRFDSNDAFRAHYASAHKEESEVCSREAVAAMKNSAKIKMQQKMKRYKCEHCSKRCNLSGMKRHYSATHNKSDKHTCSICLEFFLYTKDLRKHVDACRERTKCQICGKPNSVRHWQVHYKRGDIPGNPSPKEIYVIKKPVDYE